MQKAGPLVIMHGSHGDEILVNIIAITTIMQSPQHPDFFRVYFNRNNFVDVRETLAQIQELAFKALN